MKKIQGVGRFDTVDYGFSTAWVRFKFRGKVWRIYNEDHFSSPEIAKNQIEKICDKFGIEVVY